MKIRLEAFILVIFAASMLSGCVRSCYESDDIVMTQVSVGDASAPEIVIPKFPVVPVNQASGCQSANLVRVELYIDVSGYVRGVTFLDPWPNDCANAYVRHMESSKILDAPLANPLNHFRVDIHNDRVSNRQCIKLQ